MSGSSNRRPCRIDHSRSFQPGIDQHSDPRGLGTLLPSSWCSLLRIPRRYYKTNCRLGRCCSRSSRNNGQHNQSKTWHHCRSGNQRDNRCIQSSLYRLLSSRGKCRCNCCCKGTSRLGTRCMLLLTGCIQHNWMNNSRMRWWLSQGMSRLRSYQCNCCLMSGK